MFNALASAAENNGRQQMRAAQTNATLMSAFDSTRRTPRGQRGRTHTHTHSYGFLCVCISDYLRC